MAAPTLAALTGAARPPARVAERRRALPDIQFDVGDFIGPAATVDGVVVRFPPVYSSFVTVALTRRPTARDRERFAAALAGLERRFPFAPRGVLTLIGYGRPYFDRLPNALVRSSVPRLRGDGARSAFEEAIPGPTDPGDVTIERNDMVLVLRSDSEAQLAAAQRALVLPGLMRVTSRRLQFVQPGLPRKVADAHGLPFAGAIDPRSPLWMGFADQQVGGSGPPAIVTFAGNASARETTARRGDYFDHGSVLHLSHLIEDLERFYAQPPAERVAAVFRSNPAPAPRVYVENTFTDAGDAEREVAASGRVGHLAAVQRTSRAGDGTPLHIRLDGAGFDALDVVDGVPRPKLHFAMLVPSADRFARLRRRQGELPVERNGIEPFVRATRRQNFLVPPRRHRVFPLSELR
ncbi:hypothetical protein OM076_18460 [Solirubrobacter ginsenosidimutans]|uniref:Uncharacterized protein n=1 Tax=Solirubrobacter ginsenosidimutans TaxID=490573 RepID=A0A9X3MVY0_9ACTN|nr:hypothetical protein [Solirubrobacter ginsenosidimutans]MDA0162262.1 hypothetical protein [Solirubrobacter ginsenosidimutans]